ADHEDFPRQEQRGGSSDAGGPERSQGLPELAHEEPPLRREPDRWDVPIRRSERTGGYSTVGEAMAGHRPSKLIWSNDQAHPPGRRGEPEPSNMSASSHLASTRAPATRGGRSNALSS